MENNKAELVSKFRNNIQVDLTAEMLRKLAATSEPEILKTIARNPNTPIDILIDLAKNYLEDIGENPALELILFEDPNLIESIYEKHFRQCYYSKLKLPDWYLGLLLKRGDRNVLNFIARNAPKGSIYLERLAINKDPRIRATIGLNQNTPVTILEKLARDKIESVRFAVASNLAVPVKLLETLVEDKDDFVKSGVAENLNSPAYILEKLADRSDRYIKLALAENNNTPLKILEELAEDLDWEIRRKVAINSNTPIAILNKLSEDSSCSVRRSVVKNLAMLELKKLTTDRYKSVRKEAIKELASRSASLKSQHNSNL